MNCKTSQMPCRKLFRPVQRYTERKDLRRGDWICLYCNNHNFSFRQVCNRCDIDVSVASEEHEPVAVAISPRLMPCYAPQLMRSQSDSMVHSLFPKAALLGGGETDSPLSEISSSGSFQEELLIDYTEASRMAQLLLDE